jgi:hypothetical protein
MSISCPWCYKRVTLQDIAVKGTCRQARVQTCGQLVVHRTGSLVASVIEAMQGIELLGHAEGAIVSGGPVVIGPKARVKGNVTAPSIWMEPGAVVEGGYFKILGPARHTAGPSRPPEPPVPHVPPPDDRPVVVVPAWRPVLRRT